MNIVIVISAKGRRETRLIPEGTKQVVNIGRAWNNDIVLDDEYVDANHLQVSFDEHGKSQIEDLDSKNGTFIKKFRIKGVQSIHPGLKISLGNTVVEILDADMAVPAARRRDALFSFIHRLSSWPGFIMATMFMLVCVLADVFLFGDTGETREILLWAIIGIFITVLLWSLFSGLIGKLFKSRMHFKLHWVFACLLFGLAFLTEFVVEIFRFNLNSQFFDQWIVLVNLVPLLMLACFGFLSLATETGQMKKVIATFMMAIIPVAIFLAVPHIKEEKDMWSSYVQAGGELKPPAFVFNEPVTLDNYLRDTNSLFSELDEEVVLARKGEEDSVSENTIRVSEK